MAHVRRHPKSGRWQVRYRDPSGRERSRNFERKVDADRFASTVIADVVRGDYLDPTLAKMTVGEFAERWQATRTNLAQSTRDRDRSVLTSLVLPTFGSHPVGSVRPSEVAAWVATLDRAPYTLGKALRILFSVLEMARRDGAVRTNAAADVPAPRQEPERTGRALSDDEVAAVLAAAVAVDPRTAPMVTVMATMGLRVGEAMGLRRDDVDLRAGVLQIRRSLSRREGDRPVKGRQRIEDGRAIPIPDAAAEALRDHLSGPVADLLGYVFTAPRGGPIRYTNWRRRVWSRIVERVGFDVHPHDLRHTVATRLFVVDRWTPAEVQTYLGHRDPRVTLRVYTHVAAESLPRPSSLADTSRTPGTPDEPVSVAAQRFRGV